MRPVLKLWYSSTGELRLLKEPLPNDPIQEKYGWINGGLEEQSGWSIEGGEEAYFEALRTYPLAIERIKRESLLIVNAAEILKWHSNQKDRESMWLDTFHDLPGAAWGEYYEGDKIVGAFIHLPKAENSISIMIESDGTRSFHNPDNPAPDPIEQLAAADKRIAELEQFKKEQLLVWSPVRNYCQDDDNAKRLGISIGDSISKRILEILKEYKNGK
jgi:hypothetical protein